VEVHPHPDHALSDGAQSLTPRHFAEMMARLRLVAEPLGRRL
jgi:3-deoxy-7-phosphoheptulonate synthase